MTPPECANLQDDFGRQIGPSPALARAIRTSVDIVRDAREAYQPTHIVAMVSGGRAIASAYALADEPIMVCKHCPATRAYEDDD